MASSLAAVSDVPFSATSARLTYPQSTPVSLSRKANLGSFCQNEKSTVLIAFYSYLSIAVAPVFRLLRHSRIIGCRIGIATGDRLRRLAALNSRLPSLLNCHHPHK